MSQDPKYTDEQLDHQRKMFREAARETSHKTFVPVENAGQVADMLDDLKERREKTSSFTAEQMVQITTYVERVVADVLMRELQHHAAAVPLHEVMLGPLRADEIIERAKRSAKVTAKYVRSADVNAAMQDIFPDSRFNDPADV